MGCQIKGKFLCAGENIVNESMGDPIVKQKGGKFFVGGGTKAAGKKRDRILSSGEGALRTTHEAHQY